jgi:riboflavin transporter FmnP
MRKQTNISNDTKRICGIAAFAAMAYVVTLVIHIPVPVLTFNFTLDFKDALICIGAFLYGPLAGVIISFITAFIEFVSISGTGLQGLIMNFASSATFSFVASFIYMRRKSLNMAIIGLYAGVAAMVTVMMGLNLIVTPYYTGFPISAVLAIIPTVLLPFNLAKGLLNGAIALMLYKPVVIAMRRARLMPPAKTSGKSTGEYSEGYSPDKFSKQSIFTLIFGGVTIAVAVVIFLIII